MTEFVFSPNQVTHSEPYFFPASLETLEMTPNLKRCSLTNAMRYGGPLVRLILESAPLEGDGEDIYVETVVNYLHVGQCPTQPGWHLDDILRLTPEEPTQLPGMTPDAMDYPSLTEMVKQTQAGRHVRHHTIVVGNPCPTVFANEPVTLDIEHPDDWGVMRDIHAKASAATFEAVMFPNGMWTTWDWWNLHRPCQASQSGWRLLLRVGEGGDRPVDHDFFKPIHHVYVPSAAI